MARLLYVICALLLTAGVMLGAEPLPPITTQPVALDVAPMPRPKRVSFSDVFLCSDDDLRCKARAALALKVVPVVPVKKKSNPTLVPTSAEMNAAKRALEKVKK
jgi:hypothetical protein